MTLGEQHAQPMGESLQAPCGGLGACEVVADGSLAVGVGAGQDRGDRRQTHVEVAECPDQPSGLGLIGTVVAVSGRRVDDGRFEQPDLGIVPERADRQTCTPGEPPDGLQASTVVTGWAGLSGSTGVDGGVADMEVVGRGVGPVGGHAPTIRLSGRWRLKRGRT